MISTSGSGDFYGRSGGGAGGKKGVALLENDVAEEYYRENKNIYALAYELHTMSYTRHTSACTNTVFRVCSRREILFSRNLLLGRRCDSTTFYKW